MTLISTNKHFLNTLAHNLLHAHTRVTVVRGVIASQRAEQQIVLILSAIRVHVASQRLKQASSLLPCTESAFWVRRGCDVLEALPQYTTQRFRNQR